MHKNKECVLYDRVCIECGECDQCDQDPAKTCDNCMQCVKGDTEYRAIRIDGVLTPDESLSDELNPGDSDASKGADEPVSDNAD